MRYRTLRGIIRSEIGGRIVFVGGDGEVQMLVYDPDIHDAIIRATHLATPQQVTIDGDMVVAILSV